MAQDKHYDRRLSRVQLKQAYDVAAAKELVPSEFELHEVTGDEGCLVSEFRHPGTGAFLRFDWNIHYRTGFALNWWPSHDGNQHSIRVDHGWVGALNIFENWLVQLKREIATPDVWRIAREQRAWLTSAETDFATNTPFKPAEREQIAHHLKTIELYAIKTYQLQAEQSAYVSKQMAYLVEAAQRVGRFDWKNLAASTFIQIVLTLGLDPQQAGQLLAMATALLGSFVVGAAHLLLN